MSDLGARLAWKFRRFTLARPLRASGAHRADGPVVVAGLFSTASGIGESARLSAAALEAEGHAPLRVDLSPAFNQCDMTPDVPCAPMPGAASGTLLLHLNAPETERALFELGMMRGRRWRVIGYWAWELERLPPHWRSAARYLSEIWTPSQFVADAVSADIRIPVRVAPHAVAISSAPEPPERRIADEAAVTCLVMADSRSSMARKGVEDAIEVFLKACQDQDHARLVIKTRNLSQTPHLQARLTALQQADSRITLIDASLDRQALLTLIDDCDILLSMHKSEGFGLHIAEAMRLGKAVVATAWSGNLQFMTPDNSVLIASSPRPIADPGGPYENQAAAHWAQPDLQEAAEKLASLVANRSFRMQTGALAKRDIEQSLTASAHLKWL